MRHILQLTLVGLLLFLLLSACNYSIQQQAKIGQNNSSTTANTAIRIIKHPLGETKVPIYPQRVVVLHGFMWTDALAVGVKPIGAPLKISLIQPTNEQRQNVVDVGFLPNNLEKILAIKPDLILGVAEQQKDIYPLLSHIAPTVLIEVKNVRDWKDHFMQVANALNKTEEAQKVISNYHSRLQKFRANARLDAKPLIGRHRLSDTPVLVVGLYNGNCRIFSWEENSFSGGIIEEAGLTLKPTPSQLNKLQKSGIYSISWERLDLVDNSIIFVSPSHFWFSNSDVEEYHKAFKELQTMPLWSKLKSVQQGKVYPVKVHWVGNGPIAANHVLDDLFKYLLNYSSPKSFVKN
ncbi:MAG: iron-siderophore ABC transporter substrate-binding protein [Nostoc sp.]|uniref:iron-siderophore ABC transporter substrate-binding protein n=1 Tax=Nostoc sp. TaxID=1180 RepID=UPI002FFAEE4A